MGPPSDTQCELNRTACAVEDMTLVPHMKVSWVRFRKNNFTVQTVIKNQIWVTYGERIGFEPCLLAV